MFFSYAAGLFTIGKQSLWNTLTKCKTKILKPPRGVFAYDSDAAGCFTIGIQSMVAPDLSTFEQGVPQVSFRASRLPAGLSINSSTGVIEGTPVGPETVCNVTVTAFNDDDGGVAGRERDTGMVGGLGRVDHDAEAEPGGYRVGASDGTRVDHGASDVHGAGSGWGDGVRDDGMAVGDISEVPGDSRGSGDTAGGDDGGGAGRELDSNCVSLNTETGEIHGTASYATARQDYVLTLQNPSGKTECTLSLEVGHLYKIAPSGLRYTTIPSSSEYADPPQSTGLLIVDEIMSMTPTYVHVGVPAGNFSVRPDLPTGLILNTQSGEIHGTPSKPMERKSYTVTLENPKGKTNCT